MQILNFLSLDMVEFQKLIIGANNQSVLALVSLKGITHCIWATSEEGEVKSPSSEMFTC